VLRTPSRSRMIAAASVFAALYAVTRLIPITPYIGIGSFLTFGETVSPLGGMLFGPLVGMASVTIGTFIDFGLGRPIAFPPGLDFLPGAIGALVAGLCFRRKVWAALLVQGALMAAYSLDPLSVSFVAVNGLSIPFLWMHLTSFLSLALVWLALPWRKEGLAPWYLVAATVFFATMTAHVAGSVLYENDLGRFTGVFSQQVLAANFVRVFYMYPAERIFFTVAGTLIALPVLRALSRRG
jgi:hypothetical protein